MLPSTSTDDGFPVRCEVCGKVSIVNVSRPPGDSVCPACGSFLWVTALVEVTRDSFVPDLQMRQLEASDRDEALRELAQAIACRLNWTRDQEATFVSALMKREELGSTGIGGGFAIPHARVDWMEACFAAIAMAPNGIAFNALDGAPVHTIIMIASPTSRPGDHLRFLESVSRALRLAGY